jgi:hypothetical protein
MDRPTEITKTSVRKAGVAADTPTKDLRNAGPQRDHKTVLLGETTE